MRPWSRGSMSVAAIVVVLAAVLAIDVVAVVGAVRARREALNAAIEEVERRLELEARTFELALAGVRADLGVVAAAPALQVPPHDEDPVAARRRRLELESALLLFAVGHPILDELRTEGSAGTTTVRVVRDGAEPHVVALDAAAPAAPLELRFARPGLVLVARAGGDAARVVFGVDAATALVEQPEKRASQGEREGGKGDGESGRAGVVVAVERVDLPGWTPERPWSLVRREPRLALLARVDALAAASRFTLLLHLALVPLTAGLGVLALRGARRSARLAAERELAEERQELERRMWHSERLASVGRLAAGLAHEINNPLAGMTTWLQLIQEDLEAGEVSRAAATASKLRIGLDRIRDVVGSTLAFADPGRGELQQVDLVTVASETAAFVGSLMPELTVDLGLGDLGMGELGTSGGSAWVRGDRPALGQLLLNLLLNAAQAQGDRGTVRLEVGRELERAVLVVEDEGPGIPNELLDTLFEPFVSGRGSTGLGLSVCHGIVAAHGGRITGENRPEGGARFVVELPLNEAGDAR